MVEELKEVLRKKPQKMHYSSAFNALLELCVEDCIEKYEGDLKKAHESIHEYSAYIISIITKGN